tara:strand:+ start:2332 stop:2811 length:480 start_codon:yes stop_codon:yes gene_type:complete
MNKFFYVLFIFIIIFLNGCGFKPILEGSNYDFSIEVESSLGDDQLNSKIENRLNLLDGIKRSFEIILNSQKTKNTISMDTKGDPSILEIVIKLHYKLIENGKVLVDKRITQKSNYNNISDKFELKKSEEILIDNLVENLVSDIIFSASNIITNPMINDN